MAVGRSRAVALLGLRGEIVEIEADLAPGVPGFTLIGLPDTALGEARERVRSACLNSGLDLPAKRITINLSPAALPKHGSVFDLGIALAALAAAGLVPAERVARVVHVGELGLDGRVRATTGVLPAVLAAKRAGCVAVMVPDANAHEAALVDGIEVIPVASLRGAAIRHGAELEPDGSELSPARAACPAEGSPPSLELAEVIGNREAVEALVIAAAGGHHMFLVGPPGAGKTMLASRLPAILPPLEPEAAIEVASIRSLSGMAVERLIREAPFEAPHHTASTASIIGGGTISIRPGAVARAAWGILFLDEAPEFSRVTLDALRQPLESGTITVQRANVVARFPANFQLVLAANPCPCGFHGTEHCRCSPMTQRRYLGRLSGPLLDRVDIQLRVPRLSSAQLRLGRIDGAMTTAEAKERVARARAIAASRLAGTGHRLNAEVPGAWLRGIGGGHRLSRKTTAALDDALEHGRITMRGYDRVLRVAWSVADLAGRDEPGPDEVGRAIGLRMAVGA